MIISLPEAAGVEAGSFSGVGSGVDSEPLWLTEPETLWSGVEDPGLLLHAAREKSITSARIKASDFFILFNSFQVSGLICVQCGIGGAGADAGQAAYFSG